MTFAHQFQQATKDPSKVVLETFHALKHAVRFNAHIELVVTDDKHTLDLLMQSLAPDIVGSCTISVVEAREFTTLSPRTLDSHVIAIARRAQYSFAEVCARDGILLALDTPTHLGNVGSVIRTAAARGIAGVVVMGEIDPWHPHVVRGAAGLQFAVPVVRTEPDELIACARPLCVFHENGALLSEVVIPRSAILVFGSERRGVSTALRTAATQTVRIPMQSGVSSLNLATSAAIALYCGHNTIAT